MTDQQNKLNLKSNPSEECKHFDYCSFNCCPLDKNFSKLTRSSTDKEQACRLSRSVRKRIALKYGIPFIKVQRFIGRKTNKQAPEGHSEGEMKQ